MRIAAVGLCFAVIAAPAVVHAQASRAEAIAEEQARKAANTSPETATRAERLIANLTLNPDPRGVYPWFGSIFPGGGFAVGAGYQQHLPVRARAAVAAGWSIRNYKLLEGRVGVPLQRDGKLHVGALARWVDAPVVAYYGLGAETTAADRSEFEYQPSRLTVRLSSRVRPWLWLDGDYELLNASSGDRGDSSGRLAPARAPGINERLQFNVVRGTAAVDTRTSPGYSDIGGLYRVTWARHEARRDAAYSFDETEAELAHLVPVAGRNVVFGFRALGTFTDPGEGDTLPFVLAPSLGSGSTLRGFRNRRFQDRHRLLLTGEYRWQASRFLNMAVFLDAGQVAPELDRFRWRELETSWGIGARFHGATFTALRLELARSREGWLLVAGASQPF